MRGGPAARAVIPAAPAAADHAGTAAWAVYRARARAHAPALRERNWLRFRSLHAARDGRLLDDLAGLEQHVRGDGEPERLGRLEIDDAVELARLLHWQVRGTSASEDLIHVARRALS